MRSLTQVPIQSRRTDSFSRQLIQARAFFDNPALAGVQRSKATDNPYADKDGLIEFIIAAELVDDPAVQKKILELKKILISVTSVVTDYVQRYSAAYKDPELKTDADLWALALANIPLMGPSKLDQQSYAKHLKGISIAQDFIQLVMELVVSEGTSALGSFTKFLENQGEALRFGVEHNHDYYRTITVGLSVEVFKLGESIVYIPKIKQYRINFTRNNTKWSSACASVEWVDINFEYLYGVNVFDYEALENPEIRKSFDTFINERQKAQIEHSTTFFNGDFPPLPPKSARR